MNNSEFISTYREAFGDTAPLPIAFGYSDTPSAVLKDVPRGSGCSSIISMAVRKRINGEIQKDLAR